MRVKAIAISLMLSLAMPQNVYAQNTDNTSEAFLRAALTVMTFDYFKTKCQQGNGFVASDAAKVEAWQTTNGVNQIRVRLGEWQLQYPTQKQQLDRALADLTKNITNQYANIDTCAVALSVSQLPDSQFAKVSPQILGSVNSPPQTPNKPETVTSVSNAATVAEIDSFGFDTRMISGVGGLLVTDVYPVVLFRNGDALTNVKGLSFPGGLAAHKRAHPGAWTRWRRQGGKLQLAGKDGWKALPFQTTYAKLPDNFQLDGTFRSLSGAGTVAIGGNQSVAAWENYTFSSDGQVVRGKGAGGRAGAVVTSSVAPNQRGRYRVEGLTLYITYDDGSSERRILITDPKNPKSAIWLDGVGYSRRQR